MTKPPAQQLTTQKNMLWQNVFALFGVYLKKERMADRLGRIVPEMFVLLKYTNLYVQKQSLFISCFFTDSRPDVFVKYRRIK